MSVRSILRFMELTAPLVLALAAAASGGEPVDDVSLLAAMAVDANPDVEALRARTRELDALARVSSSWTDPIVSVEYSNAPVDTFAISDHPMGGVQFKLTQRLPEWGWTRAVREVAGHRAEGSRHEREEAETQLRRSVETLYWNLALSRALEGVTHEHVARADELLRAVRARYEVGRAGQNELLRLEVLRDRLEDDLGDFRRAERELSAGLARSLAREPGADFSTPTHVVPIEPEGDPTVWLGEARAHRPELAALREAMLREQKAAHLARVGVRPEVDVWVAYRLRTATTPTDDGEDFFAAGLAIPIPWGSRTRGLGDAEARLAASDGAAARLAGALDRIEAELISIEAAWRRALQKSASYGGTLIPTARMALETTLTDFAVGRAEFATLYQSEVDLLALERAYIAAAVETHLQRAALRAVIGRIATGASS